MSPSGTSRPSRAAASAALLLATAAWGSTFVVTKPSLEEMAPATFRTWRFGVVAVARFAVTARRTMRLSRTELRRAGLLGVLLGGGFFLQTTGLQHTRAGLSGFLTGSSVVLVPLVEATPRRVAALKLTGPEMRRGGRVRSGCAAAAPLVDVFEVGGTHRALEWLGRRQRGPDVANTMDWFPLVRLWQVLHDMPAGAAVQAGFGHM